MATLIISYFATNSVLSVLVGMLMIGLLAIAEGGNFFQDVEVNFGGPRAKILNGGRAMTLSLDKYSGSGFQSKKDILFGRVDVQMKLVPGNSAGTVTTFYLSSQGPNHDEIDFEFLGNSTGEPYTLHTNVFSQGKGNREQQFRLWFDPTKAFHTYTIVWNRQSIMFLVDNSPIRVFNNVQDQRVPYPTSQPMKLYSSLWNADDWATQGGRVRADWTHAPFTASYKNININGCVGSSGCTSTTSTSFAQDSAWQNQALDASGRNRMRWIQKRFMIYNYCSDKQRFPKGLPRECRKFKSL